MTKLDMTDFILNFFADGNREIEHLSYIHEAAQYVKRKIKENNLEVTFYVSMLVIISAIHKCELLHLDTETQNVKFNKIELRKEQHSISRNIHNYIEEFIIKNHDPFYRTLAYDRYFKKCNEIIKKERYMKWLNNYLLSHRILSCDVPIIDENATDIANICILPFFSRMVVDFIYSNYLMYNKEFDNYYCYYFKYEDTIFCIQTENKYMYSGFYVKILSAVENEELVAKYEDIIKGGNLPEAIEREGILCDFEESLSPKVLAKIPKEYLLSILERI